MQLSAPKQTTWLASVIIAAAGVLATFVAIPYLSANAFWVVVVGFVLLGLSTILKGL